MAGGRVWLIVTLLSSGLTGADGYLLWCSPTLWEGGSWTLQITHTDQGADVWENTAQFSVDVIGQRYARQETGQRNGQSYSIFYLYYYAANTLYKVQNSRCDTSYISGNLTQHCVQMPDGHALEYLKEYLGDYDTGVWSNGVRTLKDQVEYFYSEDPEGYIPLNEETHGLIDNVPTYTLTNFYNATLGIIDANVFTPPDSCIKSQDILG